MASFFTAQLGTLATSSDGSKSRDNEVPRGTRADDTGRFAKMGSGFKAGDRDKSAFRDAAGLSGARDVAVVVRAGLSAQGIAHRPPGMLVMLPGPLPAAA